MSTRISSAALLSTMAALAGCDAQEARAPSAPREDRIACQPAGADRLEAVCAVERARSDDGLVLTLRHPDGSFRRLLVVKDGRGVIAADGADPALVSIADTIGKGAEIEVSLAGNRYMLPATLKPGS